jgi:hypothetical protein
VHAYHFEGAKKRQEINPAFKINYWYKNNTNIFLNIVNQYLRVGVRRVPMATEQQWVFNLAFLALLGISVTKLAFLMIFLLWLELYE